MWARGHQGRIRSSSSSSRGRAGRRSRSGCRKLEEGTRGGRTTLALTQSFRPEEVGARWALQWKPGREEQEWRGGEGGRLLGPEDKRPTSESGRARNRSPAPCPSPRRGCRHQEPRSETGAGAWQQGGRHLRDTQHRRDCHGLNCVPPRFI